MSINKNTRIDISRFKFESMHAWKCVTGEKLQKPPQYFLGELRNNDRGLTIAADTPKLMAISTITFVPYHFDHSRVKLFYGIIYFP